MSYMQNEDWPSWVCPKCFKAFYILPAGITPIDCGIHHSDKECCHYGDSPLFNKFNLGEK